MRQFLPLLVLALGSTGCASTINTLPPVADSDTPAQEVTLQIPVGFEIQSVTYSATMYPNVSGTSGAYGITSTSVGGRAFVQVFGLESRSGEQVLLIYESGSQRPDPIQIIRFRSGTTLVSKPK